MAYRAFSFIVGCFCVMLHLTCKVNITDQWNCLVSCLGLSFNLALESPTTQQNNWYRQCTMFLFLRCFIVLLFNCALVLPASPERYLTLPSSDCFNWRILHGCFVSHRLCLMVFSPNVTVYFLGILLFLFLLNFHSGKLSEFAQLSLQVLRDVIDF
jgi:hypothetical protein